MTRWYSDGELLDDDEVGEALGLWEACRKAEAALGVARGEQLRVGRQNDRGWWVTAEVWDEDRTSMRLLSTSEAGVLYATPAEALRALTAKLTEPTP